MKISSLLLPLYFISFAASAAEAPMVEPPELTALRGQYELRLQPIQARLKEAVRKRTERYVADLLAAEKQATSGGDLDAVLAVKKERESASAGELGAGLAANQSIPTSVRQLRASYDADVARLCSNAAPDARPLALAYGQQLQELERRLTTTGNLGAASAVKREKEEAQKLTADPLRPAQVDGVGEWSRNDRPDHLVLTRDGAVLSANRVLGSWKWLDRKARQMEMRWKENAEWIDTFTLSADGKRMEGRDAYGKTYVMQRVR